MVKKAEHLVQSTPLSFSGHQTFPLRFPWLPKAVQRLLDYSDLFTSTDAMVILGVGKNMVDSIRHWSQVLGVVERDDGRYVVTSLGQRLFKADGWDPYLEDPGTLWLLHWQLVSKLEKASTWYLAFTQWNREGFSRDELVAWLVRQAESQPGTRATQGSIKRDVDVFIRTYVQSASIATRPPEETFDSPLVELGLIREVGRDVYEFVKGPRSTLPDEILAFSLMSHWTSAAPQQQTLSLENLLHGRGSPGAAFKLSENVLVERLERLPTWTKMRFDDTAGMRQLLRQSGERFEPMTALEHYYDVSEGGLAS